LGLVAAHPAALTAGKHEARNVNLRHARFYSPQKSLC
jgi:hypothetical protein